MPLKVKPRSVLLVLAALFVTLGVARSGHELPVYPSYYPHEIAIETMPPERAAILLRDAELHAYLGAEPRFPGTTPPSIRAVESLGNFVIVRINPERMAQDERSACAVVEAIIRDMAGKDGFVFHPYPVTPFHGDYLYPVDRAEAEKTRLLGTLAASPPRNLRVRASAPHARSSRRSFGTWPAKTGSCSTPTRSRPGTAITSTTSIAPRPRRRGCSARRPRHRRAT